MEEWETFINQCAHRDLSVDCNFFENALQVAQTVCDKDLAPFEIDWFLESLLVKPMGLLQILSSKFKDSTWSKTLEKAFTLLTLVVEKFPNAEPFYEDIGTLCQLAHPARVGGRALGCAARLARRRRPSADEARAHLHALACSDTCQAPRVQLLGVMCEYHPELFSDVRTLWRTFLNLLDSQGSRVSLNIVKFVLEAICGLFKNFGTDLDVIELYEFYDKMAVFLNDSSSHDRSTRKKCFEACCTILEKYADLFRERVSCDRKLRASLWNSISVDTRPAVIAVYRTCYNYGENLQELASELLAQAESNYPLCKYTALYTLSCVLRRDVTHLLQCDVSRLDAATYGDCEAIACCISANVLNSDRLLQAAILKYESLPAAMRLRTVIYSVLQAPPEIRVPAIKFLTSETCTTQDDKQTDMFMSIWKQLFNSRGGTDAVVLEHSKTVLEDFLTHVIFLLETFLKDEVEVLPPKLSALLKLTAYVLNIQEMDGNALTYSLLRIVEIYAQTYPGAEVVCVVRALAKLEEEGIKAVYGYIDINSCDDEQHLFETCLAMIEAPDGMVDSGQVLTAAKILLSKTDCECAVLSKTVKKLEQVVLNHKDDLNEDLLNDVIFLVENVRKFNKKDSKDARILHRDTLMFLGKFSPNVERNKNHNDVLIAGLKELCLNIPVPNEGIAMKLNLHGVFEQALSVEEPEVLHTVMTVICANVRSQPSPELRAALSRAWAASARGGSVPSHPALPYAADLLLPYIVNETSPRVRRILLAALQAPLTKGSQIQISALASNIIMTSEEQCNTSQAKLDLLVLLIRAFKENNLLSQKHLPTVLISVLKTQRSNTRAVFNDISNLLVEKISLFDTETLKKLIRDILNTICNENFKISSKSKRLIGDAVSVLIKLCDLKSFDTNYLFDVDVRPTPQVLFLLSHLKRDCLLSISFYREYVREKTELIYNFFELSKRNDSKELVDGIFIALATFCDVLLETHYQKTLDLLARTIKNLCIEHVPYVYKNMSKCLSAVKGVLKKLPHLINNTLSLWLQGQHFEIISEDLARGEDIEHLKLANGLSHIIDAYDVKTCPFCSDLCQIAKNWVKLIYDLIRGDQMERHYRYFSLLLRISLSLVEKEDMLDIVFKGEVQRKPEEAIKFCRSFVPVFSNFLIENHDVLCGELAIVLKDIVEYKVKTDRNDDSVLPVVDKLWLDFEAVSTFEEKHSLLLDLTCLTSKLAADSNPMRWVVETMACERTSEKEKIKLIAVLPSGDAYSVTKTMSNSAVRRGLAASLPSRLSELRGASSATLHALLDNFSATKDAVLLQILSSLADGDPTKGWWDGAMVECMKALAVDQQLNVEFMSEVYRVCKDGRTGGACERLLIPLLRYSPSPRCEEFFSTILDEMFSVLKKQPREVAANSVYQKCLLDYTRTFNILRIAFEKIPKQHLESPESQLYSKMASKTERPFYIVYSICVYGVELRKKISCPEGADGNLKDLVRTFHCSVHNCMAAALCCRRPNQSRIYANIFCVDVWRRIVDADKKYDLPLTEDWRQHTTRQAVSIDVSEEVGALSVGTKSRTVHFLRTLSEDPFLYDLPDDEEMVPTQELRLSDCSLNEHECAATITALLCHVASFDDLMMELCKGLTEGFKNMRWLLAQIVCNCKDELKTLASTLRPALLNVISNSIEGNKLNRIHIEILKTLISWEDETNELPELSIHDFNTVIKCMILTIKDFRRHQSIVASLLEKLHKISDLYGKYIRVPDECFETAVDQNVAADVKQIELRTLKVLAKSRVDITGLLPRIFEIFEADLSESNIELPKLLGVVLSVATPGMAATYAARFRAAVERVRRSSVLNYVKMVYYAQMGYTKCCDEKVIREIVDLVNKIPGKEKQKCLDIIAAHLSVASPGEHIDELFDVLDISQLLVQGLGLDVATQGLPLMQEGLRRRVVSQVVDGHWPSEKGIQDFLLMALEVSLKSSMASPPAKKRPSVSPILAQQSVLSRLAAGLNDQDALVKVAQCLSNVFAVRFCEAFTIAVYHPLNSHKRGLNCAYLTLELFFHQLRSQESFKSIKLRDEPLDYGEAKQPNTSVSTVRSLTQGGLGGRFVTDIQSHEIDVQVPIDDILQSILKFAKCQPSVASAICVEIARVTRSGHTDLTDQLLKLLESNPTPFVVNICRLYVDSCCNVDGFKPAVEKLLSDTRGTEGYDLVAALHQEMRIRSGGLQQFYLGADTIKVEDVEMTEDRPSFSINDLVSCFGKLSNWHDLTIQQRRAVSTSIPVLWTDQNTFKNSLAYYTGGVGWFDAMLAVFRNDSCQHISATLLNKLDAWPRDEFDVSAVTEASEWVYIRDTSHSEKDLCRLTCNIRKRDCLAKWAARLMLRRLFLKTVDIEADSDASRPENGLERSLSLSHQLEWCKRANEMGLPALALQCLEDVSDIYESEALKWLQQKVIALRTIGLERSDRQNLEGARDLFNRMSQFRRASSLEDIIGIDYWGLMLLKDLQLPMEDNVNEMMGYLEQCVQLSDKISKEFKETLDSVCVLMMTAWHDSWKAEEDDTNCRILGKMAKILQIYVDLKIGPKCTILADMILKRLDDLDVKILPTEISKDVLVMFNTIKEDLDDFALDVLRKHQHLFPHACEYSQLFKTEDSLASVRQMLATVGDPAHGLLQYCVRLRAALHRKEVWWQTFENMKRKIFENPYVGCDCQVLFQYKDVLYGIEEYDTSGPREKEKTLAPIILQLSNELKSADRRTLSLQQLCPKLCERDRTLEPALRKLLWLPDNATVEFDDTVSVYTDTLNRACVVSVRVCECRRRYIVKGGEPLRRDVAALRGRAALGLPGGYRVTPLSEDCGLIEYLENHERIRNLILNSEGNKTAGLPPAMVSSKDQILLSRADAVRQFEQACAEVPAFLLRSAVEQNSTSYEDFISKKSRFVESLSTVTIINWLLGVGDRHLENLMYDYRTGDVCNIDWGAMLQYGEGEIPCSRLTRNLLAVCDTQVLESRLQQILQHMRDNQALFLAVWHVSLSWMSDFKDRFCILESLLQGTVLSHSATRCALQASQVQNKERYIALLDEVFADFENKESYSIEEQVSCLLRQSTDPRILSVTRSRWEPWL